MEFADTIFPTSKDQSHFQFSLETIMSSLIVDFPRKCIQYEAYMHMPDTNNVILTKKRRTVRFSPASFVRTYEAPQHQSACSSWHTSADEQHFKKRARLETMIFRQMKEDGCDLVGTISSDMLCPVGLEKHLISREFTRKRAITRRLVTLAVLREQARHVSSKADDQQERIANASKQHSEWSRAQAQTIGSFQAARSQKHEVR